MPAEKFERHLLAFDVDDGLTSLSFYDASDLVDELIDDVAAAVAAYAVTRGSCSDMHPAMPDHEAHNLFVLFLADPDNLHKFTAFEYNAENQDPADDRYGYHVAFDGAIQSLAEDADTDPAADAVYCLRGSYVRLLQTYALARILVLLENEAAPMDQPACPLPPLLDAYDRLLPLLRRVACKLQDLGLPMFPWCEFGIYWRGCLEPGRGGRRQHQQGDAWADDSSTLWTPPSPPLYRYGPHHASDGTEQDMGRGLCMVYLCTPPGKPMDAASIPSWRMLADDPTLCRHDAPVADATAQTDTNEAVETEETEETEDVEEVEEVEETEGEDMDVTEGMSERIRARRHDDFLKYRAYKLLKHRFITPQHMCRPSLARGETTMTLNLRR
ncbi:hypothetical protein SCUCBS95973_007876 [Sporothrix curviconia]|uniref:Uncharacterized protein n=1 Tax=Sporothrix curviconia TaxID=1260050 RepID=A0ABP0CJS2_9PEZI